MNNGIHEQERISKVRRVKQDLAEKWEGLPGFSGIGIMLDPHSPPEARDYAIRVNFRDQLPTDSLPSQVEGIKIYPAVVSATAY